MQGESLGLEAGVAIGAVDLGRDRETEKETDIIIIIKSRSIVSIKAEAGVGAEVGRVVEKK